MVFKYRKKFFLQDTHRALLFETYLCRLVDVIRQLYCVPIQKQPSCVPEKRCSGDFKQQKSD